jgi:hypothetical protein
MLIVKYGTVRENAGGERVNQPKGVMPVGTAQRRSLRTGGPAPREVTTARRKPPV